MVQLVSEYDISVYEQYARAEQAREEFLRTFHVPITATGAIAAQATFRGLIPQPSYVSQLTGENLKKNFPNFAMPEDFLYQRTPNSFIMPSLTSEQIAADLNKVDHVVGGIKDPVISMQGEKIRSLISIGVQANNTLIEEILGKTLALLPG